MSSEKDISQNGTATTLTNLTQPHEVEEDCLESSTKTSTRTKKKIENKT